MILESLSVDFPEAAGKPGGRAFYLEPQLLIEFALRNLAANRDAIAVRAWEKSPVIFETP